MGCHTWFKVKIERTQEQAREKWLFAQRNWIERWTEVCNNPFDDARVAYEWTQDYCDHLLNLYKRQLRMVESGYCSRAIWNKQPDDENNAYVFIEGKGLYADNGNMPHDVFRIHNYPEDRLFSLEETIQFIEKNRDKINFYNPELIFKKLNSFWEQYPQGMIYFG